MKKLLVSLLIGAFICTVGLSAVGCGEGKKKETKDTKETKKDT